MRQHREPNFALFPSASETDAPASGSRILLYSQRHRNGCASVRDPISAPFSTPAFLQRHRNRCASVRSRILLHYQRWRSSASEMDARVSGSRLLPMPNASALRPNSAPRARSSQAGKPGNHTKMQCNEPPCLPRNYFLDSEYYNCNYCSCKDLRVVK
jgi:hypothetical protein